MKKMEVQLKQYSKNKKRLGELQDTETEYWEQASLRIVQERLEKDMAAYIDLMEDRIEAALKIMVQLAPEFLSKYAYDQIYLQLTHEEPTDGYIYNPNRPTISEATQEAMEAWEKLPPAHEDSIVYTKIYPSTINLDGTTIPIRLDPGLDPNVIKVEETPDEFNFEIEDE